jgi:hypothetical protein
MTHLIEDKILKIIIITKTINLMFIFHALVRNIDRALYKYP